VGLSSGFLSGGSGIEAAATCGVVTSTEWPVALRVLRTSALVRVGGGATAVASHARVGVSARAGSQRSDPRPPSGFFLLADLDSDAGLGVGGE
jgi:hypothetical protein